MDYGFEQSASALLDRAMNMPMNDEQVETFQLALNVAQETGDEDTEFKARLFLASLANVNVDHTSLLTHFSAAVGMHDRDPLRFPGESLDGSYPDLFWLYKNALNLVVSSVLFTREQIDDMLDQMEDHYSSAGIPNLAIDIEYRDDALINGSLEHALKRQELIDASSYSDPFDDCPTCKIAGKFALAMATKDFDEASNLVTQILSFGSIGCVMEPETTTAAFMMQALKTGDVEFARHLQDVSAKANPEFQSLDTVGRHLEFLGVTGNHSKGLALLTRYQHRLITDPLATLGHFQFYLGAYTLLSSTDRAGFGDVIVSGSGEVFGQDVDLSVDKLKERCLELARNLAREYDARNGNDNFAKRFEASTANADLDIPVNLGGSNLLLQVQTATPSEPETVEDKLSLFYICLKRGAFADCQRFVLSDEEFAQLSDFDRVHYAMALLFPPEQEDKGRKLFIDELRRQDYLAADYLEAQTNDELRDPNTPEFLTEAQLLERDLKSWILLRQMCLDGLDFAPYGSESYKAHKVAQEIIAATESKPEFAQQNLQARFSAFASNLALVDGEVDKDTYLELRKVGTAAQVHTLDMLYGQHLLALDIETLAPQSPNTQTGEAILDEVLGFLINAGLREATAHLAEQFTEFYSIFGKSERVVEMARLAVESMQAAGLPHREQELKLGIHLAAVEPVEAREILEKLLLPKFTQESEFDELEMEALLALGRTLVTVDSKAAAAILLQARAMAAAFENFEIAVQAMHMLTGVLYSLGELEWLLDELNDTLPFAQVLDDEHEAEIKLLDNIAIVQADLGMTEALDTLNTAYELADSALQKLYVQESLNRTYFTFERLDDCLKGCHRAHILAMATGDPSNAASQLEQGALYAFQSGNLEAGAEMLENAFNVLDIPVEQSAYYATYLSSVYDDLGNPKKAEYWAKKAEEKERFMD
ncbi:hypothetical protein N24_0121 [Corynebacterium suranareeae]|uniref:TPR repeat-containing protein n=1 Tax=Corynebacterium suranareeae TaxID=2506452 RepID=A0A160PNI1_9CORY|nr:hypothetical protein [Corynebacterium suranareeae]BAU94383.1 hypothetical protein N24_0121 [Corynebacterium suranareeae]